MFIRIIVGQTYSNWQLWLFVESLSLFELKVLGKSVGGYSKLWGEMVKELSDGMKPKYAI